jgi:RecA/RadA recombinase
VKRTKCKPQGESLMSIMDKLKKNSKIKTSSVLSESKFFNEKDMVSTPVPMVNVALSGSIDGGVTPGLTVLAGPSKHFKTSFALLMAGAYLKKYDDAIILFYDSEFGSPQSYFEMFGIDTSRILHTPIANVEELKFDLINQLESIDRNDKVIVVIDSIGNLASKKELDDAINEKSVADMSRAKALKGLFRMSTPYLAMKDIPMLAINHTYQEIGLFPKAVVSGGCVVEGTEIQTPDGLKEIQDFNVGEKVVTMNGDKTISHVWNPDTLEEGNPECYEIEFEDGYKVTCSDKHKFIVDGEWVSAKDLIVNMDCETL